MKRAAWLLMAPVMFAQPRLQNAKLETRAVSGSLESTVRGIANNGAAAWIGYAVPEIPGDRNMCCWNDDQQGCSLEPHTGNTTFNGGSSTVKLEGDTEFYILYRVENKQVEKIRSFSPECNIDAGGLPFYWLTNANAAQSVTLLESLISKNDKADSREDRRLRNGALAAIAMERDPSADAALDRLSQPAVPEQTRKQTAFWLGSARGRRGYESLLKILAGDPSDTVREQAVFALTKSHEAGAIPEIARVAHDDKSVRVRGQALFWLAKSAQARVSSDAIRNAIDQDPDLRLKKRAVFALTEIPNNEGVPMLIEIARSHRDPQIRKEAMTWLGRSKDPRALQFFEQVLTR